MPKLGIYMINVLGLFKLFSLAMIIFSGLVILSGISKVARPDNFSTFHGNGTACESSSHTEATAVANYAIALLQV